MHLHDFSGILGYRRSYKRGKICNDPQKLNTKLLGVITTRSAFYFLTSDSRMLTAIWRQPSSSSFCLMAIPDDR